MTAINAVKLFDWLEDRGHQPSLVEDDDEIIICCPLCSDDRPRLYINTERGQWICFHCHEEGSLYRLLGDVGGLGTSAAFELQRQFSLARDQDELEDFFDVRQRERAAPSPVVLTLPMSFQPITQAPDVFVKYLERRGISKEVAQAKGIGFSVSGRYAQRVLIPVQSDGHLFTFIGRTVLTRCPNCQLALDDCTCKPFKYPKVLTPTKKHGADPSLSLYNIDAVRASKHRPVVVMEGWADALMLPYQAVALSGSRASRTQLTLLAGLGRQDGVVLCLDPDEAGYLGAVKIAEALVSELVPVKVAMLDEAGGDANKGGIKRLIACLKAARSFTL